MTDLERHLVDLGDHLDVPAGDGLAAAVTARIAVAEERSWIRTWWRWIAGGLAAVAAVAGLTPAVADLLGVGGVAVRQEPAPTPSTISPSAPPPTLPPLDLGRAVALGDIASAAGFAPVLPDALATPDETFVDDRGHAPIVWLRWAGGPLVTELRGGMPSMPVMQKFASEAEIRWVRVGDRPALWIDGAHQILVGTVNGEMVVERLRTSDSALLFQLGALTIRIETTAGREEAIRIAASMHGT